MNKNTISEAQGLWDSLYIIYDLQGKLPKIEQTVEDLISAGVSNQTFRNLGAVENIDGTVIAKQFVFNDVLILIVKISTPEDFVTDTPELDWEQQLDIVATSRDLKNCLGTSSVIQATGEMFRDILMNVRMKIPFAREQTLHYCTFDFGHVWRFGQNNNYLMVMGPQQIQIELANKFMTKDFPYIQTMSLIIEEDYKIFLELNKKSEEIGKYVQQYEYELDKIKSEKDSIMLAIRNDHNEELKTEATNIKLEMKNYADQINFNLTKLKTASQDIGIIKNEFLIEDINKFEERNNFVQNWLKTSEKIFNDIFSGIEFYSNQIKKKVDELDALDMEIRETIGKPSIYTRSPAESDSIPVEKSPYMKKRDDLFSGLEVKTEILDTIPLEWGSSYILLESNPRRSLKIFSDLVTGRYMGLCITREARNVVIGKYKLKETAVYNIDEGPGEQNLPPVLSKISHLINEFLSTNLHSIIYLDGIDYLINFNDFNRVIKFNENINESIVLNDSIFIVSLNESTLEKNELALFMENSVDITKFDVGLEDLD